MIPNLSLSITKIENFCQRWQVIKFAVFGSVLRGDFSDDSDIDILVEFAPDVKISITTLLDMEDELENLFARPVDLGEWKSVESDPNFIRRKSILDSAKVIYEK